MKIFAINEFFFFKVAEVTLEILWYLSGSPLLQTEINTD